MMGFQSKWLAWEPPQTPIQRTDKTDKRAFVGSVSCMEGRLQGDPAQFMGWSGEVAGHARWFMDAEPPREPFQLQPAVTVADPRRWWAAMCHDIKAGPGGARNHSGAVESDLARVAGLFMPDLPKVAEGSGRLK